MMNKNDIAQRAEFLRQVTRDAGQIALDAFHTRNPGDYQRKGTQDPVTEADLAVEAFIRDAITHRFPDDGFLGEESGASPVTSGGIWVVDPIDGTDNFARGIAHFCVSVAWVYEGQTLLGAIFNPSTAEMYEARDGNGATKNNSAIAVSATERMDMAAVELGWSGRVPRAEYLSALNGILDLGANVRRAGSGALGLAWVAEGRLDAYAELHMNAWDSLAGLLLVQEAGGTIVQGAARDDRLFAGGMVFAATNAIAPAFIGALTPERAA